MNLPEFFPARAILAALETSPLGYALVDAKSKQILWTNPLFCEQTNQLSDNRTLDTAIRQAEATKQRITMEFAEESPTAACGYRGWLTVHPADPPDETLLLLTLAPSRPGPSQEAVSRDSLTGLADRGALDRRLAAYPATPTDGWPPLTILFIDLDGFKQINDQYGHLVGDDVISAVSRRIASAVRGNDFLARYGGDEFVILADGLRPGERLDLLIQRIRNAAEEPVETQHGSLTLSASIGVVYSGEGFASARDMLAAADQRMYADKRQPRPQRSEFLPHHPS